MQEQEQECENECKAHNLVLVVNSKQFIIPYMQRESNETVNWLLMRRIKYWFNQPIPFTTDDNSITLIFHFSALTLQSANKTIYFPRMI